MWAPGGAFVTTSSGVGKPCGHRLKVFHAETEPLLDYYRDRGTLRLVDADQPPDAVLADIESAIRVTGRGQSGA